ncbi:MAG: UDP-3-O-(3-hydroxymyristoyl)glucosamine N-acyltransferase [Porphyromonas sp.]|nr:UDP-3-O-(3-hydroxymyristoyl)glucosamine N-acyltransferase [Porphyromonas sp.]
MKFTALELAERLGGRVEGAGDVVLTDFSSIEKGKEGTLSFLSNMAYEEYLYTTKCSAVLVNEGFEPSREVETTLIYVPDAYIALAELLKLREQTDRPEPGISPEAHVHPTAVVDPSATIAPMAYVDADAHIGANSVVYPQAYVGRGCEVGQDCHLYPHVVLYPRTVVGDRCIIHAGAVIGADGFGFAKGEDGYTKIAQTGKVILEDDVEIGANTCIDRAVLDATIIRKGTKLDNLVMIGHNCEVGANTVIAAQSGVAGSTHIGEWNTLAGQVGVSGHLKTAERVTLAAQTGVLGDIKEPGAILFGYPAQPYMKAMKAAAKYIELPEMDAQLFKLKKEVERLKETVEQLEKKNNIG